MAGTDFNRVASRAFRRARDEAGMNQAEFAVALSDAMRLRAKARFKQSTLSGWELGTRQVPAGALLAAVEVAQITMSRALGEPGPEDIVSRLADLEALIRTRGATHRAATIARGVRAAVKQRAKN